jgi:hypothetical protein
MILAAALIVLKGSGIRCDWRAHCGALAKFQSGR